MKRISCFLSVCSVPPCLRSKHPHFAFGVRVRIRRLVGVPGPAASIKEIKSALAALAVMTILVLSTQEIVVTIFAIVIVALCVVGIARRMSHNLNHRRIW